MVEGRLRDCNEGQVMWAWTWGYGQGEMRLVSGGPMDAAGCGAASKGAGGPVVHR